MQKQGAQKGALSPSILKMNCKGMTLIEIFVVLAIIAILVTVAIPQYSKYREKANVSTYALPVARGCAIEVASQCLKVGSIDPTPVGNTTAYPNCPDNVTTQRGRVSLVHVKDFYCNPDTGKLSAGEVEARLGASYKVDCFVDNQGEVACEIIGAK